MARKDVLKRIKDDKVIDNRIQKYRLHYDYLKTCLDFPKEFKVDKSKYSNWKLEEVKKLKFNDWWKKIGSNIFGKQLDQVKEVKTTKQSNLSTFVEVPLDVPTEYAIEKIRDILQSKTSTKTTERLRPLELQIYLETFKLRNQKKKLLEVAKLLREKRLKIMKTHKSRALMKDKRTVKFLDRRDMDYYVIQRIILRYNLHAKKILQNVCNGIFPGQYTS